MYCELINVCVFLIPVQPVTGAGDKAKGTGSRTEGVTSLLYFAKILFVLQP